ncbi:MAG: dihydroorotase [Chitinophagaceae bacterium]|nr:MAG: dihydroorotase [Chitinophagaceae bacterium]
MNTLIKNAIIVDASSPQNGKPVDIFIQKGKIQKIDFNINESADTIIEAEDLHVSIGWCDLFSDLADPGLEYRETIESGATAAAKGGYSDICIVPNTQPTIDQKSSVEYIKHKSKDLAVHIHPLGAISPNCDGKALAELYDMKMSGAIAFTDGWHPMQAPGVLVKALQYVKSFKGLIIQIPDEKSIQPSGLMHEGIVSTQMGLLARPSLSEDIAVNTNIQLSEYAGSKIHLTGISSKEGIERIRQQKQVGAQVTCSVTPYHLFFTDEDLRSYDSNLKVFPVIRSASDQAALIDAVNDGTVDCIASHHRPQHSDHKELEFEYAKNGMIGLQTTYAVLNKIVNQNQSKIVDLLAINPRKILGLEMPEIKEGATACLTLFQPNKKWTFTKEENASISKNSAFFDVEFTGKPLGIINNQHVFIS